jgi:hypothetical protein
LIRAPVTYTVSGGLGNSLETKRLFAHDHAQTTAWEATVSGVVAA